MQVKDRQRGIVIGGPLLVIAAAVLWGTTGTAQAFAPEGATPLSVGTVRLVIGGLALLFLVRVRGRVAGIRSLPIRPTLVAAGGIAAYQLCFFAGVARAGVAVGTIVGIGSAPKWPVCWSGWSLGSVPAGAGCWPPPWP